MTFINKSIMFIRSPIIDKLTSDKFHKNSPSKQISNFYFTPSKQTSNF